MDGRIRDRPPSQSVKKVDTSYFLYWEKVGSQSIHGVDLCPSPVIFGTF